MRSLRPAVLWCFGILLAWVALLEAHVLFLPDLQAGPVFGDYAHNVIEVVAGLL